MKSNLVFLESSLTPFENIEEYTSAIEELTLTRDIALDKGDRIYKSGGWTDNLLNGVIQKLDLNERKFTPRIIQALRILFNSKTFAVGFDINSFDELNQSLTDRPNAFLGLRFDENEIYFIRNKKEWHEFHYTKIIEYPPTINEFCEVLSPYFANLYLNNTSIVKYLDTLYKGSHVPMIKTIIHHLKALNNIFFSIFQEFRHESLPKVCARFQAEMDGKPVPFGCSTDNDDIDSLNIDFINSEFNISKKIYCDPHTKIWDYLEDDISGDHGDRIYFSQPINDFMMNKILIGRIGCHN